MLTGFDRPSYRAREQIEDDEERLAMRQGDMPPPVPVRVSNPRIQVNKASHKFYSKSDKMHRATADDAYTKSLI